MSVRPATGPAPASGPDRAERQRAIAGDRPATELVERFDAAIRRRDLPLPGKETQQPVAGRKASWPAAALPMTPRQGPQAFGDVGHAWRKPPFDPDSPEITGLGATPQTAPTVTIAPPSAPIDPSAFADMMNQLWLREQDRQAREMRVRFGDAAWPATGASMLRLDDGSLRITVSVAAHGQPGDLEALRRQLEERGLPIADVTISTDG